MNALLVLLTLLVSGGVIFVAPAAAPGALAICAAMTLPTVVILARGGPERTFLLRLFVIGLLIRLLVGAVIYVAHFEEFFGGDANTYDAFGRARIGVWHGDSSQGMAVQRFMSG